MRMEKLTNSIDYCKLHCDFGKEEKCFFQDKSKCYEKNIYEKLREYEDAEEQKLLIKLPCKVGDTLYLPYSRPRYIKEVIVTDFMFNGCDLHILTDFVTLGNRDIGKTVFLTKEAAEQALKETKKCKYVKDNGLCGKNPACTSSGKCEEYCSYFEQALKQKGE